MKKSKHAKRALLASVLSLMLCAAMFIGSTFAWFTDSVTSGRNKIVAGNLDVELEYMDANETWQLVDPETSLFGSSKWEPGHTEYVRLRIRNAGTLALKYNFTANVFADHAGAEAEKEYTAMNGTEFKLSDYLVFSKTAGAAEVTDRQSLWIKDEAKEKALMGTKAFENVNMMNDLLLPDASQEITLAVYMPTWVGNEANQLTSEKAEEGKPTIYFGLNLFATQTPYEVDSFGKDYDIAADPGYDPFAEKDAEMLAKDPKYSFRTSDGRYWQYASRDQERGIITYLAGNGLEATLIRDIGAASRSTTGGGSDWNGQHAVLDLNGHTYTFGRLEFDQNTSNEASGTSLVFKNGTMEGTINFEDILKCRNSMQSVTLDNVTMKWDNPRAWDADKSNYRGLNLGTKSSGSVYTVKDSTLNCNAQFYTTADFSNPADRPVVNVTNTTVNGRLSGSNVDMTVKGCTVNGKVYCNSSFSSTTTVNINNSTINGNAYFDAASSQWNEVTITDTAINGNLQTNYSRNNVHITLTDVTVTGTLCWANQGLTSKVPADKVTIVSGTYGFDPTAYLASGSAAAQNAEGLWIVTAG